MLCLAISQATPASEVIKTVAFGSCLRQDQPQPIWQAIIKARPNLFLFIGDNIYADTDDMVVMQSKYDELAAEPGYQALRAWCPVHATWDDHDYGRNDAGAEFPARAASEQRFLQFFQVPEDSPVRGRPGIYDAHIYGPTGQRLQIILLDTRYFRSPLKQGPVTQRCPRVHYRANDDPAATLLGEAQWTWLEEQLRQPAELRLLISSIQVIPDQHCFEKWANFPRERARLFWLIRETQANGVILLSGDRHMADLSRLDADSVGYPLYELTASGMNTAFRGPSEPNRYRVTSSNFRRDNFGVLRLDWTDPAPIITLEVRDVEGKVGLRHRVRLTELRSFPR